MFLEAYVPLLLELLYHYTRSSRRFLRITCCNDRNRGSCIAYLLFQTYFKHIYSWFDSYGVTHNNGIDRSSKGGFKKHHHQMSHFYTLSIWSVVRVGYMHRKKNNRLSIQNDKGYPHILQFTYLPIIKGSYHITPNHVIHLPNIRFLYIAR